MSNRCPNHRSISPPAPVRPFDHARKQFACKGCGSGIGTDQDFRAHFCPCCGERVEDACIGRPQPHNANCPNCGQIDTVTGAFVLWPDPIVELLADPEPSERFHALEAARGVFGGWVAYHLAADPAEPDRASSPHIYWVIRRGGHQLRLRFSRNSGEFEVGTACTTQGCRRGIVWTLVGHQAISRTHASAVDLLLAGYRGEVGGGSCCSRRQEQLRADDTRSR